jgi:hypothetical protein
MKEINDLGHISEKELAKLLTEIWIYES